MLMYVMVEKILILSYKVRRARRIVIRAKEGIELRGCSKGLSNPGNCLRLNFTIGVDKKEVFPPGEPGSQVPGRGRP
jgi:hypothetical protein